MNFVDNEATLSFGSPALGMKQPLGLTASKIIPTGQINTILTISYQAFKIHPQNQINHTFDF